MMHRVFSLMTAIAVVFLGGSTFANNGHNCAGLPSANQLRSYLVASATGTGVSGPLGPGTSAGGLFGGRGCGGHRFFLASDYFSASAPEMISISSVVIAA